MGAKIDTYSFSKAHQLDDGSLDEVKAVLKRALRLDPSSMEAHLKMGWFLRNVLDDLDNAHKSLKAA